MAEIYRDERAERSINQCRSVPEPIPTPLPVPEGPPSLEELERRRLRLERQMLPDKLSVVVQPRHLADTDLLPGFTVDDARKLKGGEGAQFRTDAVKMVEVETARVAQLHEIVGTEDIHLGIDGLATDPANDFTGLDAALAAAQAQIIAGEDEGDSDVKEIAIVSAALMETARYQAIVGAEAPPPPEADEPLVQRDGESNDSFQRRGEAWREYQARQAGRDSVLPQDPPIGQTAEPQWKQG